MTKKHILYLEDEETLAFLTVDSLEQDYKVSHFTNGVEALHSFCNQLYDLCILDVMTPQMDGFELAQEIRKRNQDIPIIFLSAKTMKEDRIKGLKAGADDYLVKPYSMEELKLKIEIFLNRSIKNTKITTTSIVIGNYLFDPQNYEVSYGNEKTTLTEREVALLLLFVNNKNTVLKREKILLEIWGSDDYFLGRSLDVFISRLRKIFKDDSSIKIENLPRVGFKLIID